MRYMVLVVCVNEKGKFTKDTFEFDDKESVSRCLMSFKPKSGYIMVNFDVFVPLLH